MQIEEGKAKLKIADGTFYNPKMKGLRDLSVLFLQAFGKKNYSLLDATAASGVRAIRYKLEANAGKTVVLDINKRAYLNAKSNLSLNKINADIRNESIQQFCNSQNESFDVVDLDPFGTAAPYIYDIMKVCKNGTLLMVTATDTAVLCGAHYSACVKNYASEPIHNELCHEGAVRILANYIAKIASQFNFAINIRLAIANLHYIRLFITLEYGAQAAFESAKKSGFGAFCPNCRNFSYAKGIAPKLEMRCPNCKRQMSIFGALWLGSLQDKELLSKMATKMPKGMDGEMVNLLLIIIQELDIPFFYSIPRITQRLKIGAVPMDRVTEQLRKRHIVSRTHFDKGAIKTSASTKEVIGAVLKASKE